ncbi:hypothetical protein LCGC14_2612250 [marine sediment metagenome]|uniref:Uncharacterized protein n=1 Tax=marine sediment metagenome TaxID=412755 RepID=A0A0F9A5I6_9ZZZZ
MRTEQSHFDALRMSAGTLYDPAGGSNPRRLRPRKRAPQSAPPVPVADVARRETDTDADVGELRRILAETASAPAPRPGCYCASADRSRATLCFVCACRALRARFSEMEAVVDGLLASWGVAVSNAGDDDDDQCLRTP